jgi:ribosomal protein S1
VQGFVTRKAATGVIVEFFGGVTGFLATDEEFEIGQILKVFVKYVNAKE